LRTHNNVRTRNNVRARERTYTYTRTHACTEARFTSKAFKFYLKIQFLMWFL